MFRFSIRDVLWLTVVVGLAVGWWVDHRQLAPPLAEYRIREQRAQQLDAEDRATQIFWETQFKNRSAELGAPQPMPLPPGYGERPNKD